MVTLHMCEHELFRCALEFISYAGRQRRLDFTNTSVSIYQPFNSTHAHLSRIADRSFVWNDEHMTDYHFNARVKSLDQ